MLPYHHSASCHTALWISIPRNQPKRLTNSSTEYYCSSNLLPSRSEQQIPLHLNIITSVTPEYLKLQKLVLLSLLYMSLNCPQLTEFHLRSSRTYTEESTNSLIALPRASLPLPPIPRKLQYLTVRSLKSQMRSLN